MLTIGGFTMQRTLARVLYLALLTAGVTTLALPALAATTAPKAATAKTTAAQTSAPAPADAAKLAAPAAATDVLQVTKTKRPARKTPAGTIVLTAADLERGHYRSLVDALEDCPGITIGRTGYGDGERWWEHLVEQRQDSRELANGAVAAIVARRKNFLLPTPHRSIPVTLVRRNSTLE